MQIITALMNLDLSHLIVVGMVILALFGAGSSKVAVDDNSDYENASWNPSSVNYNE